MRRLGHVLLPVPRLRWQPVGWPLRVGRHLLDAGDHLTYTALWSDHTLVARGGMEAIGPAGSRTCGPGDILSIQRQQVWTYEVGASGVELWSVDWVCDAFPPEWSALAQVPDLARCVAAFAELYDLYRAPDTPSPFAVLARTYALMDALAPGQTTTGDSDAELVELALTHLRASLHQAPTLAAVATACRTSPSTLRRAFHRVQGCSPQAACTRIQIEVACRMLRDTDLGLRAIARACGFAQEVSFSRAFRQAMGCAPGQWRRTPAVNDAVRATPAAPGRRRGGNAG